MAGLSKILPGVKALSSLIANLSVNGFEVEEEVLSMALNSLHTATTTNEELLFCLARQLNLADPLIMLCKSEVMSN